MSLGAGFGPYFAIDEQRGGSTSGRDVFVSKIASISGSLKLSQHVDLRATFDRVITTYDRDTDIFMGGIGYRF